MRSFRYTFGVLMFALFAVFTQSSYAAIWQRSVGPNPSFPDAAACMAYMIAVPNCGPTNLVLEEQATLWKMTFKYGSVASGCTQYQNFCISYKSSGALCETGWTFDAAVGSCVEDEPASPCPDGTALVDGRCACPGEKTWHCTDTTGEFCSCVDPDHCATRSPYDLTACGWISPGSGFCSSGCVMTVTKTMMNMFPGSTDSACGTYTDYTVSFSPGGASCNQPEPQGVPTPGDPPLLPPTDPVPVVPPADDLDPDPDPDAPAPLWPDAPTDPNGPGVTPGTGTVTVTVNTSVPAWLGTAPIWWTNLPDDIATSLQPGIDQITGSIDGLKDALTGDPDGTCFGDPGACDGAPPGGGGDGREPFNYDGDEADLGLAWDELVGSVGQTGWLQTPDFSCMSNGSATCPPLRATIMGRAVETSVHCTIAASAGPYLQAALWLMGGLAATRAVLTA